MKTATRLSIAVALTALGMMIPAAGAQAQAPADHEAACEVTGNASISNPIPFLDIPGSTSGNYTFNSLNFNCMITGNRSDPSDPAMAFVELDVSSSGVYENTGGCGTGTADATAANTTATLVSAQTAPPNADISEEFPVNVGYHIAFTSGVGVLTVTGGTHGDGSGASGDGEILITPTGSDPLTGTCATGFDVAGEVNLHLND